MGHGNLLSSRSERKKRGSSWLSPILGWACPRSRRSRSFMRSSPPNLMAPAWDSASAAPLLSRTAGGCGLPVTLPAAQVFISRYPPKPIQMIDVGLAADAATPAVNLCSATTLACKAIRLQPLPCRRIRSEHAAVLMLLALRLLLYDGFLRKAGCGSQL